jgi:hypothetical protein
MNLKYVKIGGPLCGACLQRTHTGSYLARDGRLPVHPRSYLTEAE